MVEALLRHRVSERGLDVRVSSAGIRAAGEPASRGASEVMAEMGFDLSSHRSRLMSAADVAAADLVLGLAREHVREAALLDPAAYPRLFTLKELVRRGSEQGPRSLDEPPAAWLARLSAGRVPTDHLGSSPDDDVADPIGRRLAAYERTADELVELVDSLVELMWPATDDDGGDGVDDARLAAT